MEHSESKSCGHEKCEVPCKLVASDWMALRRLPAPTFTTLVILEFSPAMYCSPRQDAGRSRAELPTLHSHSLFWSRRSGPGPRGECRDQHEGLEFPVSPSVAPRAA